MSELERQLRNYAEQLDASAPSVEDLAESATSPAPRRSNRRPTWAVVAGAAALAALVIGSAALLSQMREPTTDDTASTSIPTTTTVPDGTTVTTAAPSFSESPYVELVSEVPVYAGGENGNVAGHPMVDAGPIVVADGTYHTLFAAGGDDEVWDAVFYASSPDGSTWSVQQDPVSFPGVEGAAALGIQSLLQLDDGTWMTFFHVAFDVGGHGNHIFEYEIRSATAAEPTGPWTVGTEPLVLPTEGAWDAYAVKFPNVFLTNDGWIMFYSGVGKEPKDGEELPEGQVGYGAVGVATSPDGRTWTKQSMPVFTGDPNVAWEEGAATLATVTSSGDGWVMLYAGRTGGSRGLALSEDGQTWTRVTDKPVLTALDLPRPAIFTTSLIDDAGVLRLYVSNGGRRTSSAVYEMELTVNP